MKKISLLVLMLLFVVGCSSSIESIFVSPSKYKTVLENTEKDLLIDVNQFSIYGKYFNIEGTAVIANDFNNLSLVFKSKKNEVAFDLIYEINENNEIIFKTNEHINEGINLEKIECDNYAILLKSVNGEEAKYYNLINKTTYENLEYYTLTKDGKNNHVLIKFDKLKDYDFMKIEVKEQKLPEEVYDIVLDPGHGGRDPGAVNGNYHEKDFNLEYAKLLKTALENLGLKVKLTREDDSLPKEYGVNSRTGIPYETKAKLMLSLHLNSTVAYVNNGGVEVYIASGDNTTFAKVIADNIVSNTSTTYSPNTSSRLFDGVYLRTYKQVDIDAITKVAKKNNWTPYENIDFNTTYYYFIRETGGILTNAVTDGRNPEYEANPYYLSNHGVEAYLIELGYISNATNLKILMNEKELYIKGLVESIKYYCDN